MVKKRQFNQNYKAALGLKQSNAITSMPYGSLVDVQNMNIDVFGSKTTRNGFQKVFELPVQEEVRSLLHYQQQVGVVDEILAYAHDTIYNWSAGAPTTVRNPVAIDTPWNWTVANDYVYAVNGTDTSMQYNGTNYVTISITPPTTAPTAIAEVGGGALTNGVYDYLITFYDSTRGKESNPSPVDSPISITAAANGPITLNTFPLPVAGQGVTHYRIYRRRLAETDYTLLAEIPTGYAFPYSDNDDTTGLIEMEYDTGQEDEGRTEHPQGKLICDAWSRLFMVPDSDPTLLVYSKPRERHAFPSANFFPIGEKDNAKILRIEKHADGILIHKRNSLWILDNDPTIATPRRISSIGTQDVNLSAADIDNSVYRLTSKGFYRDSPTEYSTSDLRSEYVGGDISFDEGLIDYNVTGISTMTGYQSGTSKHVYCIFPSSANYYSVMFVFDLPTGQWVKHLVGTPIFSTAQWEDSGKQKMIIGDDYGIIWEWDSGGCDGHDNESDESNGTVTASGASTLDDSTQGWTVNEYVGVMVKIIDGTGANQTRRIVSNTATQLTVDTPWTNALDTTSVYTIGAIDSYGDEFWNANDAPHLWKRMRWIVPYIRQTGDFDVEVKFRRDFESGFSQEQDLSINTIATSSIWGVLIWGIGRWGAAASTLKRLRFGGKYHYFSIRYRNRRAAEGFAWDGFGPTFQYLYDRNK